LLSTGILILFWISVALGIVIPVLQTKLWQQVRPNFTSTEVKHYAAILVVPTLLFLGGNFLQINSIAWLAFFLPAAIVPFVLGRLGLSSRILGLTLLALSVLLTTMVSGDNLVNATISATAGLTVWKASEILLFGSTPLLDDILLPLIWLVGGTWFHAAIPEKQAVVQQQLLLGSISVMTLLRLVETPFLSDDRLFIKRLVLAATGGLGLLIVITKLVVAPEMAALAGLVGAAVFMTYLVESVEVNRVITASESLKILVLIGILTLLASRVFGMLGVLMVSTATIAATVSNLAFASGLFWVGRALLQLFVYLYVTNVTAINVTHSYASAALYAGFVLVLMTSVMLQERHPSWPNAVMFLAGGVLAPLAANYFFHEEASGSLVLSTLIGGVLMAVAAPAIYRVNLAPHIVLVLIPIMMTSMAILSNSLITLGNSTPGTDRSSVILWLLGIMILVWVAGWWFTGGARKKPVEVPGN
jgi:hypothetical protein